VRIAKENEYFPVIHTFISVVRITPGIYKFSKAKHIRDVLSFLDRDTPDRI